MTIEENIPDTFRQRAYHPNPYIYAWKRKDLEKLFKELDLGNIAIIQGEVWRVEESQILSTIPLKNGQIQVYRWTMQPHPNEEWSDFSSRSLKESFDLIGNWDLEKSALIEIKDQLFYHFTFSQD